MSDYSKQKKKTILIMDLNQKQYTETVASHYMEKWKRDGRGVTALDGFPRGLPIGFKVLEFESNANRAMWTYATCGMSCYEDSEPIELHIFSPYRSEEPVELLVATVCYHRNDSRLNLGHTVNFGKPWIDASVCEYGLILLPYLDGPYLEEIQLTSGGIGRCYWLIPITKSEVDFKKKMV